MRPIVEYCSPAFRWIIIKFWCLPLCQETICLLCYIKDQMLFWFAIYNIISTDLCWEKKYNKSLYWQLTMHHFSYYFYQRLMLLLCHASFLKKNKLILLVFSMLLQETVFYHLAEILNKMVDSLLKWTEQIAEFEVVLVGLTTSLTWVL